MAMQYIESGEKKANCGDEIESRSDSDDDDDTIYLHY